jgi:hypothetical protein
MYIYFTSVFLAFALAARKILLMVLGLTVGFLAF